MTSIHLVSQCFEVVINFLSVNETKNHNTLIVVDWYLRLKGDKMVWQSFIWNHFIPHSSQVSIYDMKVY